MDKKQQQLGMNPSTAQQRLLKDILYAFVAERGDVCFRCGGAMARENFSVEHKVAWLDSHDPIGLFFDVANIAFSHLRCNTSAARKYKTSPEHKRSKNAARMRECYTPETRREKYRRTGH